MKRFAFTVVVLLCTLLCFSACIATRPRRIRPSDFRGTNVDFFVYNGAAYVNRAGSWLDSRQTRGEFLGEIRRTGIERRHRNWDASFLPVGTRVYMAVSAAGLQHDSVLIVVMYGVEIPYEMVRWS